MINEQIEEHNPAAAGDLQPDSDLPAAREDEIERLVAENGRLKAEVRINEARRKLTGELVKIGARSPQLLFEAIKGDLRFAPDDSIENKNALLDDLRSRFPEQFGGRSFEPIDGGAGRSSSPQLTPEALSKMTPTEIAALDWNEVKSVLSRSR